MHALEEQLEDVAAAEQEDVEAEEAVVGAVEVVEGDVVVVVEVVVNSYPSFQFCQSG